MILKSIFLAVVLALPIAAIAAPCNKAAAQDVQFSMHELADWQIEGDHLAVHWTFAIEKQPKAKRLQMITTYADMDVCL